MPQQESRKKQLAERQDERALDLFDEQFLPNRPDLVAAVERVTQAPRVEPPGAAAAAVAPPPSGRQVTGARLLEDKAKTSRLVELLMARVGVKRIARLLEVSPHSIRAAREVLVREGKLPPFKERIVRIFEAIIEGGGENYLEALDSDLVPAVSLPVGVGIFADKRAVALGEPTAITVSASAPLDRESLSVEALNRWVTSLGAPPGPASAPAVAAVPTAGPSSDIDQKPQ